MREQLKQEIALASSLEELDNLRVKIFGKQGLITEQLKALSTLSVEEKKIQGSVINEIKNDLQTVLESRKSLLEDAALNQKLAFEKIDVTLPGRSFDEGKIHPISHTISQMIEIFGTMGFKIKEGPDIEDEYYNFSALNMPENHPARHEQDTFYLKNGKVLRTHTSPVQIRTLKSEKAPLRIIAPGRTFRSDSDQTHTPMFHQIEGLVIEEGIHMGHLKGCLMDFLKAFFELSDVKLRFRPSYFPFTEPSAEVDIQCDRRDGKIKIGEGSDWLEILGCGMVHPKVIENCGLDPKVHRGFAFGMGIERVAMLKYGIPDLRMFYESDLKWLDHYGFSPYKI